MRQEDSASKRRTLKAKRTTGSRLYDKDDVYETKAGRM